MAVLAKVIDEMKKKEKTFSSAKKQENDFKMDF